MHWYSYRWLAVLSLLPSVDAATCTDAETTAALAPYSTAITIDIQLCAADMGYTRADLLAGKFLSSSTTPAQVTAFLKSANCRTLFNLYQVGTSSLSCSTGYQGVTFEQFAATIIPGTSAAPATSKPATAAPVTAAPVTAAPVTAAPVTAAPVTAAPAPATSKPSTFSTSECADSVVVAAFTPVDKERTRLLERCAIDMGSIPVQYLYNSTLKAKITDAQFEAFLISSDCAAAVTVEEKAWGTISPPCQVQFHSLAFSTAEISSWSFKEYAQRFYDRSIPSTTTAPGGSSSGNAPSRTTARPVVMASSAMPRAALSVVLGLVLACAM